MAKGDLVVIAGREICPLLLRGARINLGGLLTQYREVREVREFSEYFANLPNLLNLLILSVKG